MAKDTASRNGERQSTAELGVVEDYLANGFIQVKKISAGVNEVEIQLLAQYFELSLIFCKCGDPVDGFYSGFELDFHNGQFCRAVNFVKISCLESQPFIYQMHY